MRSCPLFLTKTITSHGLRSIFPTFDPVVDIDLKNDFGPVLEIGVHLLVAVRPDHTGELCVVVGERELKRRTVLMEIGDLANTADAVEGRRVLDDRRDPVVQLGHAKDLARIGFDRLPFGIQCVRHLCFLTSEQEPEKATLE